jgi:hypothetical protein
MATAEQRKTTVEVDDIPEVDFTKARVVRRGPKNPLGSKYALRDLREAAGKTQVDVATAADMSQGDVSRLEGREDIKIATLRRYVEALGGKLDLVVSFPKTGHRMRVDL